MVELQGDAVFLDWESLDRDDLDRTRLLTSMPVWRLREHTGSDQVREAIADASVVVSNKVVLRREHMQAARNLRLICVAATGYNNVDIDAATAENIAVCNVRDYATASVVQHVFALLLSLTNHLMAYRKDLAQGLWSKSTHFSLLTHPIQELQGQTLGIIGYGVLGRAVAEMAQHFGMRVVISARPGTKPGPGRLAFEQLLTEADVVSLHCPLTPENTGLMGSEQFKLMKSSAILINAARGALVDPHALLLALQQGQIAAAGIDVLEPEPPPADHELLQVDMPNLLLTPHIAWASLASRQRLLDQVADNILAFRQGRAQNLLTTQGS